MVNCICFIMVALFLIGCGGIGSGSGPTGIEVYDQFGNKSTVVSECSTYDLYAYIYMNDQLDTSSDYSERVQWYSDNPGVAQVSNADIAPEGLEGDEVYRRGVVVARSPGVATITAEYLGFTSRIVVDVIPFQELILKPDLGSIAPGTQQVFAVYGKVQDSPDEIDLSDSVVWWLEGNGGNVRLSDERQGMVIAGSARDSTARLWASLPECGYNVSRSLSVQDPVDFELDYQFGDEVRLPLGYSEALQVTAVYADGDSQNLSGQLQIELEESEALSTVVLPGKEPGDEAVYIGAEELSDSIGFSILLPGNEGLEVSSKRWIIDDPELISVLGEPTNDLRLTYPDSGQLRVMGLFSNGAEVDISRHVRWRISESATPPTSDLVLIDVGNTTIDAGEVSGANVRANFSVVAIPDSSADFDPVEFTVKLYPHN
jgi:hypothetical protein